MGNLGTVSITLAFRRFKVKTSKTIIYDVSNSFSLVFFSLLWGLKVQEELEGRLYPLPQSSRMSDIQDAFIIRYE